MKHSLSSLTFMYVAHIYRLKHITHTTVHWTSLDPAGWVWGLD